jgi:phosphoribosylformimino-5-aminoimidazole carboxamide ribotide isomerase
MILFPAIDLKNSQCVRLEKGEMGSAKVFNPDPAAQAKQFEAQGFQWIHIVDLNGAFEGKSINKQAVESIVKSVNIPLQLGGGIRDLAAIENWLNAGITRVILGTIALRNPELVKTACKKFPNKIVVGIDGREGFVAVEGWAEKSEVGVEELALKFEDAGVAAIVYTDIERDGMMQGPNIEATRKLAERLTTPVIASGGVSSIEDLKKLKAIEKSGIAGVISGRAIYDGQIPIVEALKLMAA